MASDSLNENTTEISISVRDLNDLPPVFNERSYEATIWEESLEAKPILQVSCTFFSLFLHSASTKLLPVIEY